MARTSMNLFKGLIVTALLSVAAVAGAVTPPPTPQGFVGPGYGLSVTGDYEISWNASDQATSYQLQRSKDSGSWTTIQNGGSRSRTEANMGDGGYGYRVRACNAAGCSSWNSAVTVAVLTTPGTPTLSAPASSSSGDYTVSWQQSSGLVEHYEFEEIIWTDTVQHTFPDAETSYSLASMPDGTYIYRVRACNLFSCSNWGSATVEVQRPPSVPTGLTAGYMGLSVHSNTGISWNPIPGTATHYTLQRSSQGNSTWETVQDTNATSRNDTGLWDDTTYFYRVRACNLSGCSGWSPTVSLAVLYTPGVPGGLSAPATSTSGSYTVSWNSAANNVGHYELQQSVNGGSYTSIATTPATSHPVVLNANGTRRYRVRACNFFSCSRWSGTKTVHVQPLPPIITAPENARASFTLQWTPLGGGSDIVGYVIEKGPMGTVHRNITGNQSSLEITDRITGTYVYDMAVDYCFEVPNESGEIGEECLDFVFSDIGYVPASVNVVVPVPPQAPASVSTPAVDDDGAYNVSWTGSSGATYYELQVIGSTITGPLTTTRNTGSATSFALSGQGHGAWNHRVRACNSAGCSDWSSSSTTQVEIFLPPFITAPANAGASFTLQWMAFGGGSDIIGYVIEKGPMGTVHRNITGNQSSLEITDIITGIYTYDMAIDYCFEIPNDSGDVEQLCLDYVASDIGYVPASVDVVVPVPPQAPVSVTTPAIDDDGAYEVSWTGSSDATYYELQVSGSTMTGPLTMTRNTGSATSFALSAQSHGAWNHRVRACNSAGCSDWSPSSTTHVEIFLPPFITAPANAGASFTLQWEAFNDGGSDIIGYVIEKGPMGTVHRNITGNQSSLEITDRITGTYTYDMAIDYCFEILNDNGNVEELCFDFVFSEVGYVPAEVNVVSTPPIVEAPPIVASPVPQTIPFDTSVDRRGNLLINTPVKVPLGINDLTPRLSLAYKADNKVLSMVEENPMPSVIGNGWTLNGFPAVRQCDVEVFPTSGVTAKYCFGGAYLAPEQSGHQNIAGRTFRLSNNSDIRFTLMAGSGQALWFQMKSGDRTYRFGKTEKGRAERTAGQPLWYLQEVEDGYGNDLSITYRTAIGNGGLEIYPFSIEYGGYQIEFDYGLRGGTLSSDDSSMSLHTIRTVVNGTRTSEYHLRYALSDSTALLSDIQYCGYDQSGENPLCEQSTHFEWFVPNSIWGPFRGIAQVTDGLDNHIQVSYENEAKPGYPTSFTERPFPFAGYADTDFSHCELMGSCPFAWQVVAIERSNGLGSMNRAEYAYANASAINSAVRRRNPDGTYTYTKYFTENLITTVRLHDGHLEQVKRYRGVYDPALTDRLISHEEWERDAVEKSTLPFMRTAQGYVKTHRKFIVESGVDVGASITDNTVNWDAAAGLTNQLVSTTTTGYGLNADGSVQNPQKTVRTTTTFDNDTSNWSIGFVSSSRVEHYGVPGETGSTIQEFTFSRDVTGSLNVGTTTALAGTNKAVTTVSGIDAVGNPTTISVSGADFTTRTQQIQGYVHSRYPQQVFNAEGHRTTVNSYDLRFGTPTVITDANDLQTTLVYDNLGRLVQSISPTGTVTDSITVLCDISCGDVEGLVPTFKMITSTGHPDSIHKGAPDTTTYHDQLGRVIREETEGFNPGEIIKVDTIYDDLGRVHKQSLPYSTVDPVFTQFSYDLKGRVTRVDYDADDSQTDIQHEQLPGTHRVTTTKTVVSSTGSKSQVRVEEYNSLGQLIRSYDAYGTADQVLSEYRYDHLGNNNWVRINADDSTIVETEYDLAGNLVSIDDPNAGHVDFTADALGQVIWQTDARDVTTWFKYDRLGRLEQRIDDYNGTAPVTNTWTYDSRKKGYLSTRSNGKLVEDYHYNGRAELSQVFTTVNVPGYSDTFTTDLHYDDFGRLDEQTYPSGLTTKAHYNSKGYAFGLQDVSSGTMLSERLPTDGLHRSKVQLGNGLITTRETNPVTGMLDSIHTGTLSNPTAVQNLNYNWWSNGTLQQRHKGAQTETFDYDSLNRLKVASADSGRTLSYGYDALGNLTSKTSNISSDPEATGYSYSVDTRPHAVNHVSIKGNLHQYGYDASGNVTSIVAEGIVDGDKTVTYNANGKPTDIRKGNLEDGEIASPTAQVSFEYGPDGARFYQQKLSGEKIVYLYGGAFEVAIPASGAIEAEAIEKTYLGSVIHYRELSVGGVTERFEYVHTDHLGSVALLTNEAGQPAMTKDLDPFGGYRNALWTGSAPPPSNIEQLLHTSRGYTGHEQLDDVGLIHMNGRVYDPAIGRFISADPIVQAPKYSQSYNRYAYTFNSPLSFTDPSGFCTASRIRGSSACDWGGSNGVFPNSPDNLEHSGESNGPVIFVQKADFYDSDGSYSHTQQLIAPRKIYLSYQGLGGGSVSAGGERTNGGNSGDGFSLHDAAIGNEAYVASLIVTGMGLLTTYAELSNVSQGKWLGQNGKWYPLAWPGNQWAGARSKVVSFANYMKVWGTRFFVVGGAVNVYSGVNAYQRGDTFGVVQSGSDLGWGAASTFGGTVGFVGGLSYFGTSVLVNIPTVRSFTVTPIADGLCYLSPGCMN